MQFALINKEINDTCIKIMVEEKKIQLYKQLIKELDRLDTIKTLQDNK